MGYGDGDGDEYLLGSVSDRGDYYSRSSRRGERSSGSSRSGSGGYTSDYQRQIVQSARTASEDYKRYRLEFAKAASSSSSSSSSSRYGGGAVDSSAALAAANRALSAKARNDGKNTNTNSNSNSKNAKNAKKDKGAGEAGADCGGGWVCCQDEASGAWYWFSSGGATGGSDGGVSAGRRSRGWRVASNEARGCVCAMV